MTEENETSTLAVPKKFRKKLVKEFDGRNDMERLKNWKQESYKEPINNEDELCYPEDLNRILQELDEIKTRLSNGSELSKSDVDEVISRYV